MNIDKNISPAAPLSHSGRIPMIDAIRGFSLLGILLANIPLFMYGTSLTDSGNYPGQSPLDRFASELFGILIYNSFFPIFMFLFGYGMVHLTNKLRQQNGKHRGAFVRRFLMLSIFGLLHIVLLWDGDILLSYGLSGFWLLLFLLRKTKTLVIWTMVTIGLYLLLTALAFGLNIQDVGDIKVSADYIQQSFAIYGNGSYSEIMNFRLWSSPYNDGSSNFVDFLLTSILVGPLLLPVFLLGMIAARKSWFSPEKENRKNYILWSAILVPLGMLLKTAGTLSDLENVEVVLLLFGGPVLALGYIFLFALSYTHTPDQGILKKTFTSVGRLSLSNYLMQSIICTFLFYGYGLGMFGRFGILSGTILGLVIYALLAFISYLYLHKFKTGPAEWALRKITYRS